MFLGLIKRFAIPAVDVVIVAFVVMAIFHMAHRADLPADVLLCFGHESVYSLDGVHVAGADDIEFMLIPFRAGDSVSVGITSVSGQQTFRIPLAKKYNTAAVAAFSSIAIIFLVLGLWVNWMRLYGCLRPALKY